MIIVQNLTKRYPKAEKNALNGIDLEIKTGEFFGLLGPNGSGKTTLISILCGLLKPNSGTATILGYDVQKSSTQLLSQIGLVPQEIALYPSLTLEQNLQFFGNIYGIRGKKLKEKIEQCLDIAQLANFRHKPIHTYSGGMKRRANLVASLIHDPKILFLDEPTANVDPQSRHVIFQSLQNLIKSGMTMVYTTHYLDEAEHLCTQLAIMDEGRIISYGNPQMLIEQAEGCHDLDDLFLHLTGKKLRDKDE